MARPRFKGRKIVTDYWLDHYCDHLCTLCGNSGVIDTRKTAVSAAGYNSGRLNWCICPNGQCLRAAANGELPKEEHGGVAQLGTT